MSTEQINRLKEMRKHLIFLRQSVVASSGNDDVRIAEVVSIQTSLRAIDEAIADEQKGISSGLKAYD